MDYYYRNEETSSSMLDDPIRAFNIMVAPMESGQQASYPQIPVRSQEPSSLMSVMYHRQPIVQHHGLKIKTASSSHTATDAINEPPPLPCANQHGHHQPTLSDDLFPSTDPTVSTVSPIDNPGEFYNQSTWRMYDRINMARHHRQDSYPPSSQEHFDFRLATSNHEEAEDYSERYGGQQEDTTHDLEETAMFEMDL